MQAKRNNLFEKIIDIFINVIDFFLKLIKINKNFRENQRLLIILRMFLISKKFKVIFIVGKIDWAIFWISKSIAESLTKLGLINAEVSYRYLNIFRKKIIHYGSLENIITDKGIVSSHKSNINILTWYHIVPKDPRLKLVPLLNKHLDLLITPSLFTKKDLIELGFDEKKIVIIPEGIDLLKFKRNDIKKRNELKKKYNLPKEKLIIGSFQKDGVGWGKGLKPKLVKGPDIFCEVVKKLNKEFNIHIFLAGPARGYVKKKFEEYNISYTHVDVDYNEIIDCYNVLDLYIVGSRVEGGPMAIPESMATGVPIVTTNVGMASNFIENGVNGFITEVEDIEQLYLSSKKILEDKKLREEIISNALKTIKKYSWENIAKLYYEKVYIKFLNR